MSLSQDLLADFNSEAPLTRRMLERVPMDKGEWRPHPKSMPLGRLAMVLCDIPRWGTTTLQTTELDFAQPENMNPPAFPATRDEMLATFDHNADEYRQALQHATDEELAVIWTAKAGDKVAFSMPRLAVLRGFVAKDAISHRAQLGLYLRMNDVPVPAVYGGSADDPGA